MGVMKVTDSDGNVGYLETNIDLTSTTPTSPARVVQNREMLVNGQLVSNSNPIPFAMTNWGTGAPVLGPGTSTANTLPVFADAGGHLLGPSSIPIDPTTKLLGDVPFVGTLQSTPSAPVSLSASQNDYNPGTSLVLDINPTANINLTGFTTGQNGRMLMVRNVGTGGFTITLANLTTSQTVNQLNIPSGSIALAQGSLALLIYDSNVTNWRVVTVNFASADFTLARNVTVARYFAFSLNNATISANQNNYAQSNSPYWQMTSAAAYTITGMGNTLAGCLRMLENSGTFPLTLSHQSSSSSTSNQFSFPDAADMVLPPGHRVLFFYDGTATKWKPVSFARGNIGNYLVASLPALGTAGKGATAFATNGRKSGEGAAAGTGVPVYFDGTIWRTYSDVAVAA